MIQMEHGMELLMAASNIASHDSVVMISNNFHPPQDGFTSEALVWIEEQKCSFRPEWHEKSGWLHYDVLC